MTKIKDVSKYIDNWAPLDYQEDYDNAGLITGNEDWEVKAVLISLDVTEEVILEAKTRGANLIISHHPIVFKSIKKIDQKI